MKKNSVETAVTDIADTLAASMGLYVVDVEYKKEGNDKYLRIYIDKGGGVGIDDCESFSREVEPLIDEKDPISEAYILEVSSPGADRRLVTDREFTYYIGREVDVKLYKAVNSKKEFTGTLTAYQDGVATVCDGADSHNIKTAEAVYIRLHFEF